MNYLRELLYRPKRSDKSLMARFFYADEALNQVAAELDSFDGRKDPDRCSCLVNKLRQHQDKLLSICNKMIEEVEPGIHREYREFRAKFPDDILTDSLPGQLWFGAECLAAGSSILNKEAESEQMRPLAKAVTKSLEKVRQLLREQCLRPQPEYTEKIRENLKIFDRLFADFEYNYVQCMVHVKTVREFELHQDIIVLFSECLHRAAKNELVSQDMIDNFEPSVMFAIPRLSIVGGLLIFPDGPLNPDRRTSQFPELFAPFKNLLRKIRELLVTLDEAEVLVLEMLLCQLEEPQNLQTKLQETREKLTRDRDRNEETQVQADKLQQRLYGEDSTPPRPPPPVEPSAVDRLSSITCDCDTTLIPPSNRDCDNRRDSEAIVRSLLEELVDGVSGVEIDCSGPEPEVRSSRGARHHRSSRGSRRHHSSEHRHHHHHHRTTEDEPTASTSGVIHNLHLRKSPAPPPAPPPHGGLHRKNAMRDPKRIPVQYQKEYRRRAKFRSTEDLLHRLYVCISGAADQLQSNFASDFRSILKTVFSMHVTEDEDTPDDTDDLEIEGLAVETVDGGRAEDEFEEVAEEVSEQPEGAQGSSDPAHGNQFAQNLDYQIGIEQQHDPLMTASTEQIDPSAGQFFQPEPRLIHIVSSPSGNEENQLSSPNNISEIPPEWVPDEAAPICMGCQVQFTLFKRRHHCRSCGCVFCNHCSSHNIPLPQYGFISPVRVCNRCYVFYMGRMTSAEGAAAADGDPQWSRNYGMVS